MLNRIRGPFNVSVPAQKAAAAALLDRAHVEANFAHNEKWRAWLTGEIRQLGLRVDDGVANFVLIHFADAKTAKAADDFLSHRGIILRGVASYGLPVPASQRRAGGRQSRRRGGAGRVREGPMTKPLFDRVAILGFGLLGSSRARMRRGGVARHIVAHDRKEPLAVARRLKLADSYAATPAAAVKDADLVILATPVGAYGALAKAFAANLKPGAIVSDVGSVKGAVIADVGPHIPKGVHFVPPIPSPAPSSPALCWAGFAELFDGRWCLLTRPRAPTSARSRPCACSGSGWAARST